MRRAGFGCALRLTGYEGARQTLGGNGEVSGLHEAPVPRDQTSEYSLGPSARLFPPGAPSTGSRTPFLRHLSHHDFLVLASLGAVIRMGEPPVFSNHLRSDLGGTLEKHRGPGTRRTTRGVSGNPPIFSTQAENLVCLQSAGGAPRRSASSVFQKSWAKSRFARVLRVGERLARVVIDRETHRHPA